MPYPAAQRLIPSIRRLPFPRRRILRSCAANSAISGLRPPTMPDRAACDFIDRRGVPAQTRNYVRAIIGRSVDEWVGMAHDGGKDGIAKRISCRQLAALLKERPSFVIGKVERKAREAGLA